MTMRQVHAITPFLVIEIESADLVELIKPFSTQAIILSS